MDSIVRNASKDDNNVEELCFPNCNEGMKPYVGQNFETLEEGIDFYLKYARSCGFEVRKGTYKKLKDGTITLRHVVCSKEGVKRDDYEEPVKIDAPRKQKRKRLSSRMKCLARVVFSFRGNDGYVIKSFNEEHTHKMVPEEFRHLMKCNRKMGHVHQMFVLNGVKANIGPMRSFRFYNELVGDYEDVRCRSVDFKNYARDLRAFVVGVDAQIILDKFKNKQQFGDGFKFEYFLDESECLRRLFWADSIGIQNYQAFGEAVSFDSTYHINRYNMIFTPFTGKDNHGKCVTFAASLIFKEDIESYS